MNPARSADDARALWIDDPWASLNVFRGTCTGVYSPYATTGTRRHVLYCFSSSSILTADAFSTHLPPR